MHMYKKISIDFFVLINLLKARDLCVGYGLAATCYVLIGVCFFVAFPARRDCLADNFLNNFGAGDVLSATARVFLLFQVKFWKLLEHHSNTAFL